MTNTRPLEAAEIKLINIIREFSKTSILFRDADLEVARIIRRAYSETLTLRCDTEANDEGDRALIRAYGNYLAKVAKALQSL